MTTVKPNTILTDGSLENFMNVSKQITTISTLAKLDDLIDSLGGNDYSGINTKTKIIQLNCI